MKKLVVALVHLALVSVAQETDDWPAALSVSTNVDGAILTLEFADASVVAGERLRGRMVVSSESFHFLEWEKGGRFGYLDTEIGQFVVVDDRGNRVPKTVWRMPEEGIGGRGTPLRPGKSVAFPGDLVKKYSLTNPGTYFVKAVANVGQRAVEEVDPASGPRPTMKLIDGAEDMIVETPFVAITVLARPPGMPPPGPLHTQGELADTPKYKDPPQLLVTHPKPERPSPVPRAGARETRPPLPQAVAQGVQDQSGAKAITNGKKDSPSPSRRRVLLALIAVMLSGGLVVYLVWSRRRHGHPLKKIIVGMIILASSAFSAPTVVHTNANGVLIGFELGQTNIVAGERLIGTMSVWNNSQAVIRMGHEPDVSDHTRIGRFVVVDERGSHLPVTLPARYRSLDRFGASVGCLLRPGGAADGWDGDIVWNYAGLTNPGNYFVKAVIPCVPLVNSQPPMTFEAETPWIAITVTPRPKDSPPLPPLYPEMDAVPRKIAVAQGAVTATAKSATAESTPRPRRNQVLLFAIGVGLFVVGFMLWRARRRAPCRE
jgi:hypothetical protein